MRATRELLRRRMPLMRKRAERLTHIHHPKSQDNLPAIGQQIASKAHRDGVAERCRDPAVHKSLEVALALLGHDAPLLRAMAWCILKAAREHHANTLYVRRTVPGSGELLSLVLLYAMHDIDRCPRGQDCAASCRLVKCSKASAGKRSGTSGAKLGNAYLTWACSEAAVLFLRDNPAGQKSLARLETKHGKGKALSVVAHKLARAV